MSLLTPTRGFRIVPRQCCSPLISPRWNSRRQLFSAAELGGGGGSAFTSSGKSHDFGGVLSSLAIYFNALHTKRPDEMRKVWHPACRLMRPSGDGGLVDIGAEDFFTIVGEGTPNLSNSLQDAVHSIQFSSSQTAIAKLEISLGESTYTDFLALLRLERGWQICAKLFASRSASLPYAVDTTPLESAHAELSRVTAEYVGARRAADSGRLAAVLHPSCQILCPREGELLSLPRSDFIRDIGMFAVGEADAALEPRRFDRVVSIDKSGQDTALVKLHIGGRNAAGDDRLLTDILMLVRVGGGWRIVTRVFTPREMCDP